MVKRIVRTGPPELADRERLRRKTLRLKAMLPLLQMTNFDNPASVERLNEALDAILKLERGDD